MPIIKSAKKRVRQEVGRRQRNTVVKRNLRDAVREFEAALDSGKKAEIAKALRNVQSLLGTATKKNLIHKNKAARRMSRLNTRAKAASGVKKTAAKSPATKKPAAKKAAPKKTTKKA